MVVKIERRNYRLAAKVTISRVLNFTPRTERAPCNFPEVSEIFQAGIIHPYPGPSGNGTSLQRMWRDYSPKGATAGRTRSLNA